MDSSFNFFYLISSSISAYVKTEGLIMTLVILLYYGNGSYSKGTIPSGCCSNYSIYYNYYGSSFI